MSPLLSLHDVTLFLLTADVAMPLVLKGGGQHRIRHYTQHTTMHYRSRMHMRAGRGRGGGHVMWMLVTMPSIMSAPAPSVSAGAPQLPVSRNR